MNIPSEFLPDQPVYLGATCQGCGEQIPTPEESATANLYPTLETGQRMYDVLAIDDAVWHLQCAFDASTIIETTTPRTCPDCGEDTPYRPRGSDPDYRICPTCPATLSKASGGGDR